MNNFLQRFTVGKRMFAGFGLMLALMASIAVVSAWSLSTLEGHLEKITVERVTKTRLADALYRSAGDLNLHLHAMLLAGDEDRLRPAKRSARPTSSCRRCRPAKAAARRWRRWARPTTPRRRSTTR